MMISGVVEYRQSQLPQPQLLLLSRMPFFVARREIQEAEVVVANHAW